MRKFKLLLIGILLSTTAMSAQQILKGVVKERITGDGLPGVSVVLKGTINGTSTDFDGNFEMTNIKTGDVLVFTYLGFKDKQVTIGTSFNITVELEESAEQLNEIVVVGYGSVRKEDLTGTADLITAKEFNKGPVVSAQQLISGKVAGVSVTSGSGAPGEGQNILIRGNGSLSLSSNPLIVIDGIPLDNGGIGGSRNPLNLINPNDIESMVVLKDASATSIYGSRAANGVIMITTKKGKNSEFKFNINSSTTVHTATDKVDVLSTSEFINIVTNHPQANAATLALLGNASTDWQDEIYTDAIGSDHSISAIGNAFGFLPMRASFGYSNHDGILKRDNFNRTTGSLNLSPEKFLDDHLKVEVNLRGTYTENFFANRDAIGGANSYAPTQPVYDANSPFGGYSSWIDSSTGLEPSLANTNPVALLNLRDDSAEIRRFIINSKIDYKLHFFSDITATISVGLDKSNSNGRTVTSDLIPTSDPSWNGSVYKYSNNSTNKLFDAYLTYTKSIKNLHNINLVVGHSYQSFEYDNYNYDSEKEEDGNDYEFIDKSKNVLLSYFGRLNYDYNGKYLFTATLRADASSKLNPDDRWGYFPSVAFAWNIHKEDFLNDSFLNELKLRVGYGEVGNVNGLGDYLFLTRYTGSQSDANYQFGNSFYQTYRPDPLNENLKWEVGNTFNLGLDFSMLDNRVSGSFNAYLKETKDLIAFASVDPFTNFGSRIDKNIGDMENKGIELAVNVIPVKTDDLEWSINYNVAFNKNEITRLPFDQEVGGISGGVGNNVQLHTEGESPYSFNVFQQIYDANGKPIEGAFVDRNGDNIINDADKYLFHDPYADIIMGLNTNLNYKKWDLSIVTRANIGNYAYNNVASGNSYLNGIIPTTNNFLWNIHSNYLETGFLNQTDNNFLSSHFIENASFFKIDNITLGYTLDNAVKDTSIRLYGSLQNVLTITDYTGLDPEITGGIDNSFYPRPQSFLLGVNIDF